MKRYFPESVQAVKAFVRDGYVVYHGIHSTADINACAVYINAVLDKRKDIHEQSVSIMDSMEMMDTYVELTRGPLYFLQHYYLGPDVCLLGKDALWINVPKDKNPVLLKGIHSDAWTGTSMNTVFVKTFLTDCDQYNGITVYPGTHLQGMWPVRNREIVLPKGLKLKGLNLADIKAGDVLVWHPLLLHKTTGHSNKNIRISITSRYSSTETAFSSQERALGYRTMSVGPMNTILRMVGNDQLTPMRTLGGNVSIDKRIRKLYPFSPS